MDPLSTHVESFLQHIRIERNYYYCVIKTMHIETVHMSDSRKDHAREYALAGFGELQSMRRHDAQDATEAPRGRKPSGIRAGLRKARGSGGESRALSAARKAYAAIHKTP